MPDLTPKGVPYANPADPNDLTLHTQVLAEWIDANPGIAPLTTAGRDALTGSQLWDGRVILNLTTGRLERYDAGATIWWSASVSDHGELAGLADDDHPQYLNTIRHDSPARHGASVVDHGSIGGLADDDHPQYVRHALATAKGDLLAATAAGAVGRLGLGADGQVLTADSAQAAGMRWSALPNYAQIATGTYVGDATGDRTIVLPFTPKHVRVVGRSVGTHFWSNLGGSTHKSRIYSTTAATNTNNGYGALLTTNGFIVSGNGAGLSNANGETFDYLALG